MHLINCAGSTAYTITEDTRLSHLPDCDSWDWQPPKPELQLREGAYYEMENGTCCGPIKQLPESTAWKCGKLMWTHDGKHPNPEWSIKKEIDKPEPKYRPFANAEEFAPHRDRWIKEIDTDDFATRVSAYRDQAAWVASASVATNYDRLFERYTFDNGEPFGVEVME